MKARLLLALAVTAATLAIGLHATVRWSEATGRSVPRPLRGLPLVGDLYRDPAYGELLQVLRRDRFDTVWDFDHGVALSRELFLPTQMYGRASYRYRPNIGVRSVMLWSGISVQSLLVPDTPELDRLLAGCRVYHSASFHTDERGFKKLGDAPAPGQGTVVFLGDSFTEGLWVAGEKTFAAAYGARMRSEGLNLVPRNLGVNGYSALEMAWTLERFGPELKPRLVVVNLFPNDVHWDARRAVLGDVKEAAYGEMFDYLEQIKNRSGDLGSRLVVAVIPSREQFDRLRGRRDFQARVEAWCSQHEVAYLDPFLALDQAGAERVYLGWDPHFSAEGHAVYADFLYRETSEWLSP